MSLVAFGIRIAAVRAIQAAIWPEFAVVDSPPAPLDLLEAGTPLIAIYTGHDTDRLDGRGLFAGQPRVAVTMQVFLPPEVTVTVAGAPLTLDTRRSGADTVLDVVERRIFGAFLGQAEPWSRILFDFVQQTPRSASNSYLVETGTVRTAAREITMECEVIHEPIPGAPPADVWARFVALMRTDAAPESVAPLADWIAAEIAGPVALTQADRDRIDLGLSVYAAGRVGILPVVEDLDDDPGAAITIDDVSADPAAAAPDGYEVKP